MRCTGGERALCTMKNEMLQIFIQQTFMGLWFWGRCPSHFSR